MLDGACLEALPPLAYKWSDTGSRGLPAKRQNHLPHLAALWSIQFVNEVPGTLGSQAGSTAYSQLTLHGKNRFGEQCRPAFFSALKVSFHRSKVTLKMFITTPADWQPFTYCIHRPRGCVVQCSCHNLLATNRVLGFIPNKREGTKSSQGKNDTQEMWPWSWPSLSTDRDFAYKSLLG